MELILQPSLPHQQKAVDAVADVFAGVPIVPPAVYYANPVVDLSHSGLAANIAAIQSRNGIAACNAAYTHDPECLNIDIKMETGTGKTYVYVHTMHELHKRYGINKFIVAVPSLAIKTGARQFMDDEYVKRHFRDVCGYGTEIELLTLNTPKKKKKGRQYFPAAVSEFVKGSNRNSGKIYVLLVNMQLLKVAKNYMLSRDDYGSVVEGFYRPFDALRATRPFLIIDEPHKFAIDQKAFGVIKSEIAPQCVIRYGATFPEVAIGRGREKKTIRQYANLLYDLNACQAFNQGLIKGVAKEHFEPISKKSGKVKLLGAKKNETATFQYWQADTKRTYQLRVNDPLSIIDEEFNGITVQAIGNSCVELSNGQTKNTGEVMDVDVYMNSYQEQMLRLALQRHFETERENFSGRKFKIKTLALFFIDDIASYRPDAESGKRPYLLEAFERLLKEMLEKTISQLDENENEYRTFLEASLANIEACHGGYFAQDNSSSDEKIAEEVDDILKGKKQLLSFKDSEGNYVLRRFLFSKWTLKEGWDNPNVFTIAKLRSSGSETSKLQEVGRGLRLPVDECGNRIANQEFTLNYIVDFSEADFANKLVEQINGEVPETLAVTLYQIKAVAEKMHIADRQLLADLLIKEYINSDFTIVQQNRTRFFEEYPLFSTGVNAQKIKDRNKAAASKPVGIRKARYAEIAELWNILNQQYTIWYDSQLNTMLDAALLDILNSGNTLSQQVISSHREIVKSDGNHVTAQTGSGSQYAVARTMPYGLFLKRISGATNVPATTLHRAIKIYAETHGAIDNTHFNEQSASYIISRFADWKTSNLYGYFRYKKTNAPTAATALTHADGSMRNEIAQGRIGTKVQEGEPMEKYLYDTKAYDSPLELENINADIAEVVVYGKIPRSSIAIPTITGDTYSPDFMYVVKKNNGEKELNIVVETKDVENKSTLRGTEEVKIKCAEVFFQNLSAQGFTVRFKTQLNNTKMLEIVNEVLHSGTASDK